MKGYDLIMMPALPEQPPLFLEAELHGRADPSLRLKVCFWATQAETYNDEHEVLVFHDAQGVMIPIKCKIGELESIRESE